ncbi:hypothetical protein VC83_06374 [Pseudogymnoascus destructans]|uniref:Aminoglycoside phosphotransferase domain-containing protein n=2 Tax=Pseudogymnoascus destructans TaxID=655981 RepID=L8GA65_PSED2|nr:uncharacterized protein VC83_06374 [Pseudogymnoascus destructans]ELR09972.1 hypothetical protein GMDG_00730 [Pseudogymnoascus destructans 20631-21]OAF58252.1 hypothetical protein VC83_06374 [Pseudogymnoascus destructans]
MPANPQIHATGLPDGRELKMDFLESSFFKNNGPNRCLPMPAEVRALSGTNQAMPQPLPVIFEHINLIVKFGPHVAIAEAQCLWVIKRVLCDEVPVPEVYGWRVDGRDVFIYMQYVRGERLKDRWDSLSIADKTSVCDQIREITTSLRQVEQDPNDSFIGSINRQHLLDIVFEGHPPGGPFATVKQFNDWFSRLPWLRFPNSEDIQDPYRTFLPDTGTIKLTMGTYTKATLSSLQQGRHVYMRSLTGPILDGILIIGNIAKQHILVRLMENGVIDGSQYF